MAEIDQNQSLGCQTQIDRLEIEDAANQQAGSGEDRHGERDLSDHEHRGARASRPRDRRCPLAACDTRSPRIENSPGAKSRQQSGDEDPRQPRRRRPSRRCEWTRLSATRRGRQ